MDLNTAVRNLLADHGADLIGIGDVADLAPDGYRYAIVAAIALPVRQRKTAAAHSRIRAALFISSMHPILKYFVIAHIILQNYFKFKQFI